jgi:hypothetical protein
MVVDGGRKGRMTMHSSNAKITSRPEAEQVELLHKAYSILGHPSRFQGNKPVVRPSVALLMEEKEKSADCLMQIVEMDFNDHATPVT